MLQLSVWGVSTTLQTSDSMFGGIYSLVRLIFAAEERLFTLVLFPPLQSPWVPVTQGSLLSRIITSTLPYISQSHDMGKAMRHEMHCVATSLEAKPNDMLPSLILSSLRMGQTILTLAYEWYVKYGDWSPPATLCPPFDRGKI